MGDESPPILCGKHLLRINLELIYSSNFISTSNTPKYEIHDNIQDDDFDITEGITHHEDQVVIDLNLIENGHEKNEGVLVWLIGQPMPHVPNVILYRPLKRLLVPNEGQKYNYIRGGTSS